MGRKRQGKGQYKYLAPTPDCFFPILLIHARLAYRIVWNPMEVDWIHCSVTEEDHVLYCTPVLTYLDGSEMLAPKTDQFKVADEFNTKISEMRMGVFTEYTDTETGTQEGLKVASKKLTGLLQELKKKLKSLSRRKKDYDPLTALLQDMESEITDIIKLCNGLLSRTSDDMNFLESFSFHSNWTIGKPVVKHFEVCSSIVNEVQGLVCFDQLTIISS